MKKRVIYGLLALIAAGCAFCLRERSRPQDMHIPVTQVFSHVPEPTVSPLERFGDTREKERQEAFTVLKSLSGQGDAQAEDYLFKLMERREQELAVEGALAAMGYAQSVCAVRESAVSICLQGKLEGSQAQAMIELCMKITGECAENVFLLDECGYLW